MPCGSVVLKMAFISGESSQRHRAARLAEAVKPAELTEAVLRSIEGFGEACMKKLVKDAHLSLSPPNSMKSASRDA